MRRNEVKTHSWDYNYNPHWTALLDSRPTLNPPRHVSHTHSTPGTGILWGLLKLLANGIFPVLLAHILKNFGKDCFLEWGKMCVRVCVCGRMYWCTYARVNKYLYFLLPRIPVSTLEEICYSCIQGHFFGLIVLLSLFGQQVCTTIPKAIPLPWGPAFAKMNSCYDSGSYFRISLPAFRASFI